SSASPSPPLFRSCPVVRSSVGCPAAAPRPVCGASRTASSSRSTRRTTSTRRPQTCGCSGSAGRTNARRYRVCEEHVPPGLADCGLRDSPWAGVCRDLPAPRRGRPMRGMGWLAIPDHLAATGALHSTGGCGVSEQINGPVELAASSDAELEQLVSEYRYRKTRVAEETERLDVVKSRLKARLQESANGAEKVLLHAEGGKPVSLTYKEAWRLDSARL